jgi:hypothetical protein
MRTAGCDRARLTTARCEAARDAETGAGAADHGRAPRPPGRGALHGADGRELPGLDRGHLLGIREDHRTRTEDRSGGPGGIVHGLEPFGPPTEAWSRDLGQVMLIPQLVAEIVAGVDEELPAVDPAEPVARRDAVLDALPAAEARTDL